MDLEFTQNKLVNLFIVSSKKHGIGMRQQNHSEYAKRLKSTVAEFAALNK